ncbi:MAG: winged helix-turn-helix transcriptional regulator [Phycisphaerales bacterium]|nr:winged helix-turn-helix transcriptional regulator [Phycisphaerales bacterium]
MFAFVLAIWQAKVRLAVKAQAPYYRSMERPLIYLKDLPKYECLLRLADLYPQAQPDAIECYLVLLHLVNGWVQTVERSFARKGISRGKFSVLATLWWRENKGIRPSQLADMCGVTRATMTGLLIGLQRSGLVRRVRSREDRRVHTIELTPRGLQLVKTILPGYYRLVASLTQALGADKKRTLAKLARDLLPSRDNSARK